MIHEPIKPSLTPADIEALEQSIGRMALGRDGTILRINGQCLAIFDYLGWELVGRNRSIFRPVDASDTEPDAIDRVFQTGEAFSGEIRQIRRDGTPFWIEASCIPGRGEDGDVDEVVMLVRDVTDRMMSAVDDAGQIAAINTSQAVIHFAMNGTILHANDRFLDATGYRLDEIVGQHHRMFVDPREAAGSEYQAFWDGLRDGTHASGEYRRVAKDGRSIWLRATYNPIFDLEGRPFKIVKYAVDVTPEKKQAADFHGQIAAIDKSQCVVTFAPDGTIIDANDNFLDVVGYSMDELEGRHHRMFVDPAYAHSLEYEIFWSDLVSGRHRSGEFRRVGKDLREVWFQAIYSPVLDQEGRPFKIVKYATAVTREKLRQADHQGQIAAIHKSQSVVSFDINGNILDANDNFLDLTGYRLSQVRGRHHAMFVPEAQRETPAYAEFWRDLAAGQYKSGEFKRMTHDGREIWLQASYNPILDMNGRPFKVVKNAVDVTEQKLRQGDYEGQIAAIHKSQAVVSFDLDGTIIDANDNFLTIMGYDLAQVQGKHHRMFVDAATASSDEYARFWADLREGRFTSAKFRRRARDGSDVWLQASYNPIYDLNGKAFKIVKIAADITGDVALAADFVRAQQEVQHDSATGLPNRLGLRRFLGDVLAVTDNEVALFYLDLDHFKPINDTFGHDVGDMVLRTVARRLQDAIGEGQLAARIGGDEFVVAAANLTRAEICALAEKLIEVVAEPIAYRERSLQVGLSIGIALTPQDTLEEDELFRLADVALYRSKGTQRGTYTFYAEDTEEVAQEERHLAHEMLFAIKARQFELQWAVRLGAHGPAAGTLALEGQTRWNHPKLGTIGADRFLRVAEHSGLIVPLGDWMMREACKLAVAIPDVKVSIPIYPRQMLVCDLPEMATIALRESGVQASRLEMRLERGTARVSPESLTADLERLRRMGITVVADDALIGDDALAQLGSWTVDRIIVDQRLRGLLHRRSHAYDAQMRRIEETPCTQAHWAFEIGQDARLYSFMVLEPVNGQAARSAIDMATEMYAATCGNAEDRLCPA